jgi:hypothetical protein
VRIPAYYRPNAESEYQPVTAIGSFSSSSNLIGIIIPESVTSIGGSAFANSPLATVTFAAGSQLATIGASAFQNCTNLASITIPAGVTSLPEGVSYLHLSNGTRTYDGLFSGCTKLATVTFAAGSRLESIGNFAFSGCTKLASITIPASVTSIGNSRYIGNLVFLGCSSLTSITVSANNPNYASEGGILYNKEKTTLVAYPSASGNVTLALPASVTSIGNAAFYDCSNLTSITIPTGITSISTGAFFNCTNLASINIPASVYSISNGSSSEVDGAFSGCSNLASINIPASVTFIDRQAFSYCHSLTSITIPASVSGIDSEAFSSCSSLASVTFADTIPSNLFSTYNTFPGDLRAKFYATDSANGTPGTYTRPNGSTTTWTRQ